MIGQQTSTTCCALPPATVETEVAGTGASSPGTAVLQIGSGFVHVWPVVLKETRKPIEPSLPSPAVPIIMWAFKTPLTTANDVSALVEPADGTILSKADPNWESAFLQFEFVRRRLFVLVYRLRPRQGAAIYSPKAEAYGYEHNRHRADPGWLVDAGTGGKFVEFASV